ncbi:dienelactone hydrolase family protein [Actinokineospora inagensis]|uniref:dienelactone hydrolase family protein n=1 Tax=Actinokineospora inagensis TaxID=103730 RepID=UPI0004142A41|nr:alpha/beta fold hydrolase [Actinokineospora inagensis]
MSVIELPADHLEADLVAPPGAPGIVLFAHGTGSSRHSPRNRAVAEVLNRHGIGTLLMDLLTPTEAEAHRFDLPLLTGRLLAAIDWVEHHEYTHRMKIGLFGSSTGAAAALRAAAARPWTVRAVVSRGGRPDLAESVLDMVSAPTLLVVGQHDPEVMHANEQAQAALGGPSELRVVLEAGHLFTEHGAMNRVCELSTAWFRDHLRKN